VSPEPVEPGGGSPGDLVETIEHDIDQEPAQQLVRAALDPAAFAREHFAFDPYPYQRDVLDAVVLRGKRRLAWIAGRRVGKSEGIAQLVLQLAVRRPGSRSSSSRPASRRRPWSRARSATTWPGASGRTVRPPTTSASSRSATEPTTTASPWTRASSS
jgi:hypothetical protein